MLTIYTFSQLSIHRDIAFNSVCSGEDANSYALLNPVHVIPFETPQHLDYYEYDGILRFSLTVKSGTNCHEETLTLDAFLDDGPALQAIPDYKEYLALHFPDRVQEMFEFPMDRRSFRLVRIGSYAYEDYAGLLIEAKKIRKLFFKATKYYFQLDIHGVDRIDWEDNHAFFTRVKNWYKALPKATDATVLQWSDKRQRFLVFLMFMWDHRTENATILRQLYPPKSNGEDFTIYFADGIETLGRGMGDEGLMVRGYRHYPSRDFYSTDSNGQRVHRLEIPEPFDGFDSYWENYLQTRLNQTYLNTTIHEMGHTFWGSRVGLTFGDLADRHLPFYSRPAMIDASLGYFTRNEFMSYGRDRSELDGQTYGDEILSKLIEAYKPPEIGIEATSGHQPEPVKGYYKLEPGETFSFELQGQAGSGIRSLSYEIHFTSGVNQDLEGSLHGGEQMYPPETGRVRSGSFPVALTFPERGIYTYRCLIVDRLEPVEGHIHRSERLLTVIVG
ncbi:MAG: hypothetical protein R3B47_05050 [Bacteroidia bacterium]